MEVPPDGMKARVLPQPLPGGGDGGLVPVHAVEGGPASGGFQDAQAMASASQSAVQVHAPGLGAQPVHHRVKQHRQVMEGRGGSLLMIHTLQAFLEFRDAPPQGGQHAPVGFQLFLLLLHQSLRGLGQKALVV